MRIIKNLEDIFCLRAAKALPPEYLDLLEKDFVEMVELLGGIEEWNPQAFGYMTVLESGDNLRDMSVVGLNPEDKGLLGTYPEIIDVFNLNGLFIYKILVIYSNDYAVTFYSKIGQFDNEVEAWIKSYLTE